MPDKTVVAVALTGVLYLWRRIPRFFPGLQSWSPCCACWVLLSGNLHKVLAIALFHGLWRMARVPATAGPRI